MKHAKLQQQLNSPALKLPLAQLPTPIQQLGHISSRLWIKRDDLTGKCYGGNKVRKLEYILAELKRQNKKRLVTFGAIGTNHGVACASYCQQQEIECQVLLFGQPLSQVVRRNLLRMQLCGADLVFKGSLLNTVLNFYWRKLCASRQDYFIGAGGSNVFGCLGFVAAAFELRQQIDEGLLQEPSCIVCPVGSGSTAAGLLLGCQLAGLTSDIIAVRVAPAKLGPLTISSEATVLKQAVNCEQYLRDNFSDAMPDSFSLDIKRLRFIDEYYGEGYGVASTASIKAEALFKHYGLVLENTYTAKAAAKALAILERNSKAHVLYWHTFNSQPDPENLETAGAELPSELQSFVS